jgi:hypothetical protein
MEHKAMVYGDALSAFWEKEAQEHIAKKWSFWVNRLINAVGRTRVGTLLKRCAPPRATRQRTGAGRIPSGLRTLSTR